MAVNFKLPTKQIKAAQQRLMWSQMMVAVRTELPGPAES